MAAPQLFCTLAGDEERNGSREISARAESTEKSFEHGGFQKHAALSLLMQGG